MGGSLSAAESHPLFPLEARQGSFRRIFFSLLFFGVQMIRIGFREFRQPVLFIILFCFSGQMRLMMRACMHGAMILVVSFFFSLSFFCRWKFVWTI